MNTKLERKCEPAFAAAHEFSATMSVTGSSTEDENITEVYRNDKLDAQVSEANSEQVLPQSVDLNKMTPFTSDVDEPDVNGLNLEEMSEGTNPPQQSSPDSFPYEWFKAYMETMKKDIVREISNEVIRNVMENLNKRLIIEPSSSSQFNYVKDQSNQLQSKQHDHPVPNSQFMEEERHKIRNKQWKDESINSAGFNKESTHSTHEIRRKLQKQLDYTLERLQENMQIASVNDLDNGGRKHEESIPNNEMATKKELYPAGKLLLLQSEPTETMYNKSDKLDVPAHGENQLRMNCSITGHQILNKAHVKDQMVCSGSDIDNISICSVESNNSDVQSENNFEVINLSPRCKLETYGFSNLNHMLYNEKVENDCTKSAQNTARYNQTCKDENNGSSRNSPSFELLSESASPSLSVYIDDDRSCHNENTIDHGTKQKEYILTEQDIVQDTAKVLPNARVSLLQPKSVEDLYDTSDLLEVSKSGEKELRMNCSITGHQILNKSNIENVMLCSASEKKSIDLCFSSTKNAEPHCEHSFELVQMPACSESNGGSHKRNVKNEYSMNSSNNTSFNDVIYQVGSDRSSTSSPGGNFESLPDTVSVASSMYMNEDHFSCNKNDVHSEKSVGAVNCSNDDASARKYCPYHGGVNENTEANCGAGNCANVGLEKRAGGTYSFVGETLPAHAIEGSCPLSESEQSQRQRSDHGKETNVDGKRLHTCDPTKVENSDYTWSQVPLNHCNDSQPQPDVNEFAQSFHSHTTSITDTNGHATGRICTSNRESIVIKHNTTKSGGGKIYCREYTKKSSKPSLSYPTRSRTHASARKYSTDSTGETADPVHILPESLVAGMPHAASLVCRVIDKFLVRKGVILSQK